MGLSGRSHLANLAEAAGQVACAVDCAEQAGAGAEPVSIVEASAQLCSSQSGLWWMCCTAAAMCRLALCLDAL